jgi:DNA-binding transcriptional ArsR family regulator
MDEGARSCSMGVDSQYVELAAEVFRLLADPTRIRLVLALRGGELPVHRLAELVGKSPTAVSQHLAKLRWGRLVLTRQEGNKVFYRLADQHARTLVAEAVFQAEHALEPETAHERAGVPLGAAVAGLATVPAPAATGTPGPA